MPVHKSDAGWARFRERTGNGARARRARMDHRVRSAVAAKPRAVEPIWMKVELGPVAEVEAVSICGLCIDGICDGTCE
jgi:hypothetical protein